MSSTVRLARRHRPPVEPDPDRVAALAEDLDLGDAIEGRQAVDDEALDVVGDLGGLMPVAGDRDPHHRVGIAVALGDLRLVDLLGQVAAHPRDGVAHVVGRLVDVAARLELDRRCGRGRAGCSSEIVLTPAMPATAPSISSVMSVSTISGAAPV